MSQKILIERDISIPMRDGVILKADLYRRAGNEDLPTILVRTPYGKGFSETSFAVIAAEEGYAVVIQDTRGRWASEGENYPFFTEKDDGFDTITWASQQSWCNGKIGMYGSSYYGYTQFAAASTNPPGLCTIIPNVAFSDPSKIFFPNGVFALGTALSWSLMAGAQMAILREPLPESQKVPLWEQFVEVVDQMSQRILFRQLPLNDIPLVGQDGIYRFFWDCITNRTNEAFWNEIKCLPESISIPVLHIGGWYDPFIGETIKIFQNLHRFAEQKEGNLMQIGMLQKLVIGPWVHGSYDGLSGEVDFGLRSWGMIFLPEDMYINWFNHWLKDEPYCFVDEPPIKIFVMGDNTWRDEYEWPLSRTQYTPYYLHSHGSANSLHGNGWLSPSKPDQEPVDNFVYDPRDPVPTLGGGLCCWNPALAPGVFDQRPIEERQDVLVFTSPPLDKDLEVTGFLKVFLWATSSAEDTDFTAKLVDVEPDGYARNIQDGITRASCHAELGGKIKPGTAIEFQIDLSATSNVFKTGHCIRLEISSSNFPRFERNPNTFESVQFENDLKSADQTIFHDINHPSHILLPIIPR